MLKKIWHVSKNIWQENSLLSLPSSLARTIIYKPRLMMLKKALLHTLVNKKKIYLYPNCPISSAYLYSREPDKAEIEGLIGCVINPEKTTFLDIGSNMGGYSMALSHKVNKIFAIDPTPESISRVQENIKINHLENKISIFQGAMGNEEKVMELVCHGGAHPCNTLVRSDQKNLRTQKTIKVKQISLDQFSLAYNLARDDDYILKIDVEGHEVSVLEGATHFLETYRPKGILFESFSDLKNIQDILSKYEYKITHIKHANYLAKSD